MFLTIFTYSDDDRDPNAPYLEYAFNVQYRARQVRDGDGGWKNEDPEVIDVALDEALMYVNKQGYPVDIDCKRDVTAWFNGLMQERESLRKAVARRCLEAFEHELAMV